MEQQQILEALSALQERGPKRKFSQTIDVTVKLRDLDVKKQDQKVDTFVTVPHPLGKDVQICALVDGQLQEKAKKVFPYVIHKDEFPAWAKEKAKQKHLAKKCSFFIAQVEVMPKVAQTFGKTLGPRGKMPSPKAGCVVPGAIPDLTPLKSKLERTVKIKTYTELAVKFSIGKEDLDPKHLAENLEAVHKALVAALPSQENNIKSISLKYTMGPAYTLGKGFAKEGKK